MLDNRATRGAHCRSENPQRGKGESEHGVCAKSEHGVRKAKQRPRQRAGQYKTCSSMKRGQTMLFGALGNVGNCNNTGQSGAISSKNIVRNANAVQVTL